MSMFRRLANLARGKVLEWQKALDEVDSEELVERARDAARRAGEELARAAASFDEPVPERRDEPSAAATEPEGATPPVTPTPDGDVGSPETPPRKRRL